MNAKRFLSAVVLAVLLLGAVIPLATPALAAPNDVYWVGDSGNWTDAATHWAAASGGAPNAANLPASNSSVHFDANSFTAPGQTVTLDNTGNANSVIWTGALNNPTFAMGTKNLNVYGNITMIAGMTVTSSAGSKITLLATGARALDFASLDLGDVTIYMNSDTGSWTLSNPVTAGTFWIYKGTFNQNNGAMTFDTVTEVASWPSTVTLNGIVNVSTALLFTSAPTYNLTGSSIRLTGTATFDGGGVTFDEVQFNGTAHTISSSNTFANFDAGPAGAQTLTFTDGTTQTVTAITCSGFAGNLITMKGTGSAGWGITKAGGGTVTLNFVDIIDSSASPALDWWADSGSVDSGNNTGWVFYPAATTNQETNVGVYSAQLNSLLSEDGDDASNIEVRFQYYTGAGTWTDNETAWVSTYSESDEPYVVITGLTAATTYNFRVQVKNTAWTYSGGSVALTTAAAIGATTLLKVTGQGDDASLTWTRGAGSVNTLIRYKTGTYPSGTGDGTIAYLGANSSTSVTNLTAGATYYFRAWGEDSGYYSAAYQSVTLTMPASSSASTLPTPAAPTGWFQTPNYTNFSGFPLYPVVNSFSDSLSMPRASMWFLTTLFGCVVFAIGILVLTRGRGAVLAVISLAISIGVASTILELLPTYMLLFAVVFGLGAFQMSKSGTGGG